MQVCAVFLRPEHFPRRCQVVYFEQHCQVKLRLFVSLCLLQSVPKFKQVLLQLCFHNQQNIIGRS